MVCFLWFSFVMNGHIPLQSSTWAKETVVFLFMELLFEHAQTQFTCKRDEKTNYITF